MNVSANRRTLGAWGLGVVIALLAFSPWPLLCVLPLLAAPGLLRGLSPLQSTLALTGLHAPLMVGVYATALPLLPAGLLGIGLVIIAPVVLHLLFAFPIAWLLQGSRNPWRWALAAITLDQLLMLPVLGLLGDPATPSVFMTAPMWLLGPGTGTMLLLLAGAALVTAPRWALLPLAVLGLAWSWRPGPSAPPILVAAAQRGDTRVREISDVPPTLARSEEAQWFPLLQGVDAALVVLPENATAVRQTLAQVRRPFPPNVLYGGVSYTALAAHNSVLAGGRVLRSKRELVPLTERPWLTADQNPLRPVQLAGHQLGVLICVEGLFAPAAARLARQGAEILVVPASTKAFHAARFQDIAARAAASSAGLPLILASEAGGSVIVDPHGHVLSRAAWGQPQVIRAPISPGRPTLYAWTAPAWPVVLSILLLVLARPHLSGRSQRSRAPGNSAARNSARSALPGGQPEPAAR
ncbi:nitrilase-related carbon-nitrogen hydrolase [Deinococcus gobiensis]|uniref:nitrilase-related carbon-nitrogen hydrolase n=1 Tax=Deinococcus gobiensis TaxID=502394 RepID=UPI0011AE2B81|nr:nitrilase-related carbon-nitrogen hydrolase [Deinococcus gobiensis]